jgi:hypothetical protein
MDVTGCLLRRNLRATRLIFRQLTSHMGLQREVSWLQDGTRPTVDGEGYI